MTSSGALHGGCACGAVRYRLEAEPFDAGYCHCRICQTWSGAPAVAFGTVPRNAFVLTRGEAARFRSSDFGERWFCAACGSGLAMTVDHQPETIDFTLATLDTPSTVEPRFHIWTDRRIAWFDTADGWPRFGRFRPQSRGLPRG
jgi:hypothetical protein